MDIFDSLREVDSLLARRKFGRAAELLRAAVAHRPAAASLRLRLADALALDHQRDEAAQLLEQVAGELAGQGFTAKAIAVLKKLQRLRPDAAEVETRLAELIRAQEAGRARVAPAAAGLIPAPAPAAGEIPAGVKRSPLFASFSGDELLAVIHSLRLHSFAPGQVLVSEGEPGDSLFVLASGDARVFIEAPDRHHREVRRLEAGDIFGEISLLTGGPRSATVVAATDCEVLELDRAAVLGIAARHASVRATIERFCLERADSAEEKDARGASRFRPAVEPETGELDFHSELPAPTLGPGEIAALVPFCQVTTFSPGDTIFGRGDVGDRMFVIDEGEVEIRFEQRRPAKRLGPGEVFGELALMTATRRRTATTVAATHCRLISIDGASWRRLANERPDLIVGLLEKSCGYLVESEQRLVHDLKRRNRELERALDFLQRTKQELSTAAALAQTDELTGIYNRRCFEEQMRSFVARARESGITVALLLADVDRFKSVNDTYGHQVGDLVLTSMAQRLQSAVRWSDLPCRIGGDEFAILWTDLDPRGARRRARDLQPLLSAFEVEGSPASLRVTTSLGGASLFEDEGWEEFFARADRALYLSKRTGRGRLSWDDRLLDSEPITA